MSQSASCALPVGRIHCHRFNDCVCALVDAKERYYCHSEIGALGNYWKHVLTKHGDAGQAVKTRYDEFMEGRKPTTVLPATATVRDANFRERVEVKPQPPPADVGSAPVDPVVLQQAIASFAGSLKAPPKKLKPPKYSRRPITVPPGFKPGCVKSRDP